MGLLDIVTGGASGRASDAQRKALEALSRVQTPSIEQLTLPELEKYAVAANMTPAQMQAFLQQNNALATENTPQTGTNAQIQALNQLAQVSNAGAAGTPTQRAQVEQINQDAARNLAGQRGAIDQQAQARGVSPGMLQAALSSQRAGEGQQEAHMAALGAQSNAYQQALNAMAQGGALGGQLQGQQNTQANTVAQAQNAMQQFNAANQQNAAAQNAGLRQQAGQYNTGMANQIGQQNTGLGNQRTMYNAQLPQQNFQNQMQKASGVANQYGNIANTATGQGQQMAGLIGGLVGTAATAFGGPGAGAAVSQFGGAKGPGLNSTSQYSPIQPNYSNFAEGGIIPNDPQDGMCMKSGGMVPGHAPIHGDHPANDTVHANLSPGELVVPRTIVQNHPEDIAALLAAMRHLRGQ